MTADLADGKLYGDVLLTLYDDRTNWNNSKTHKMLNKQFFWELLLLYKNHKSFVLSVNFVTHSYGTYLF